MTFGAQRAWRAIIAFAALLALPTASTCRADETAKQFWPQFYLIKQFDSQRSALLMVSLTNDRATRDMTDGEIGLEYLYTVRPNVLTRIGYHYLRSNLADKGGSQTEHRINFDAGPVWRLKWNVNLYDRNRIELRAVNEDLSWRYRNRLRLERNLTFSGWVGKRQLLTPYTMAELTYDTRQNGIVRWRYDLGILTNLTQTSLMELYVARQNNVSPDIDSYVNALGVSVTFLLK